MTVADWRPSGNSGDDDSLYELIHRIDHPESGRPGLGARLPGGPLEDRRLAQPCGGGGRRLVALKLVGLHAACAV
ncbi:hypothetical protein GCM10009610_30460 [Pseudonocardia xinjiangensis]